MLNEIIDDVASGSRNSIPHIDSKSGLLYRRFGRKHYTKRKKKIQLNYWQYAETTLGGMGPRPVGETIRYFGECTGTRKDNDDTLDAFAEMFAAIKSSKKCFTVLNSRQLF